MTPPSLAASDIGQYSALFTISALADRLNNTVSFIDDSVDALSHPGARKAAMMMIRYLFPVVVFVGTIGNTLSALVLVRQRMRTTSIYVYLLALAGADTLVLYVSAFKTWIRIVTGVELLHVSDTACRCLTYLFVIGLHLSAWLIVLVTVDRFIAVWLPLRAIHICTVRRARLLIVALTIVLLVANSHIFWTIRLRPVDDDNHGKNDEESQWMSSWPTSMTENPFASTSAGVTMYPGLVSVRQSPLICAPIVGNIFANVTFNYIKAATYTLVPFVIVAVLNSGIIWRAVHVTPKLRRNFGVDSKSDTRNNTRRTETERFGMAMGSVGGFVAPAASANCSQNIAYKLIASSPSDRSKLGTCPSDDGGESGTLRCGSADKITAPAHSTFGEAEPNLITSLRRNSAAIGTICSKDAVSIIQVT